VGVLIGCAAVPHSRPAGFVNRTRHSEAELWVIWKAAQQNLATQVDLNPLQRSLYGGSADIRPGDPKVLSVKPQGIEVAFHADVSATDLFSATGVYRSDPTGLIACPAPCNIRFAAAYSFYAKRQTEYATSWEFAGDNFSQILQYEFENHILNSLGYDMRWR
jgi:hypothetical protein